jgi:hypothetical protein
VAWHQLSDLYNYDLKNLLPLSYQLLFSKTIISLCLLLTGSIYFVLLSSLVLAFLFNTFSLIALISEIDPIVLKSNIH